MSELAVQIGADVTKLQTGAAIAKAELKDVSAEVKNFAAQMIGASEAAQKELLPQLDAMVTKEAALKAEIAETSAKLREHKEATEESGNAFVRLRETTEGLNVSIAETKGLFTGLGELFLVGLGAEKFIELAKSTEEWGDKLQKAHEETGISVQDLSALSVSADHADLTFDQLTKGISKFGTAMQAGIAGSGMQRAAFDALGISTDDLKQHSNDAAGMLDMVAEALDRFGDGENKQTIVTTLFGAKLRDIQPVLQDLAENGLEGMRKKAADVGLLFDGEFSEAMKKAHDNVVENDEAWKSLGLDVGQVVLPNLTAVYKLIDELIAPTKKNTEEVEVYKARLDELGLEADELSLKMLHEGAIARWLDGGHLAETERQIAQVKANVDALSASMHTAKEDSGPWDLGADVADGLKPDAPSIGANKGAGKEAAQEKREKEQAYQETIAQYQAEAAQYSTYSDERIAVLGKELALAKADWGEGSKQYQQVQREMTTAERQQLDERIRQGQQVMAEDTQAFISGKDTELQAFIQHENALATQKKITVDEAAAQEVALTQAIYTEELKRLNIEINFAGDDLALWTKLTNQKIALAQKEHDQIQKITDKAADEEARKALQTDKEIARSGAQTATGLIFGKTTVLQAAENLLERGVEKVIESGLEELLHHISFQTAKTSATIVGEQAQLVAKETATAEGSAISATAASKDILNDAYQAAAGAYKAVVGIPYVGPILAPIAAGVAFAGVAAFDVISAEGGIDRVPYDGAMFELHKDETVLSRGPADTLRELADGGGAGNGFHMHGDYSPSTAIHVHPAAGQDISMSHIEAAVGRANRKERQRFGNQMKMLMAR